MARGCYHFLICCLFLAIAEGLPESSMVSSMWTQCAGRGAGGPAVRLQPELLNGVATNLNEPIDVLWRHNPMATFTSRGCIRNCDYCAVPELEGDLHEMDDWEVKPIVCDNNLLACSQSHFDLVIDRLKGLDNVDFNQGLDCRLMTATIASRLAELNLRCIRLAWDHSSLEPAFMRALEMLLRAGIPKGVIRVYVLIGYKDSPEDALYRLRTIKRLGLWPNPMRYQPIRTPKRNAYAGANWSSRELNRYMRYWQNLRKTGSIPFEEFGLT